MNIRQIIGVGVSAVFVTSNLTPAQAQIHHQVRQVVKVRQVMQMTPKQYAQKLLLAKGFGRFQFDSLIELWRRESNWNPKSKNRYSSAFGIAQMLTETSHDPFTQIRHGLDYIFARYGSPSKALGHAYQVGWY